MSGIPSLGAFQNGFARALVSDYATDALSALVHQPGFAVYRNTVVKGCIDALQANFPAVARLTGDQWFRGAAAEYVRQRLPHDARLLFYGEDFPDFLAHFSPAAELPYLSGVACLDRFWIECHAAPDDDPQEPGGLLALSGEALGARVVQPRAAARWRWFDGLPVHSIWRASREETAIDSELAWTGEGTLLVRHAGAVTSMKVGKASCAFLDACAAGRTFAEAAAAALDADMHADLAQLMAGLLTAGALCATH